MPDHRRNYFTIFFCLGHLYQISKIIFITPNFFQAPEYPVAIELTTVSLQANSSG
jgi:hypothetical protein